MSIDVRHNEKLSRYELHVDDNLAGVADYREEGDVLVFPHTEIVPRLRGHGLGEELVRGALDDVRKRRSKKVRPLCWFVADFMRDHPEYADLKAS